MERERATQGRWSQVCARTRPARIALLLGSACACHAPAPSTPLPCTQAPLSSTRVQAAASYAVGRSVEGRRIEAHVVGEGSEVVLFLATIHGDEAAGTPLLERLASELESEPALLAGKRAIVVPVVNPDGYAAGRRTNANGVDLNRNFPAENQAQARRGGSGPLSEPESSAISALIELHAPARAVSIHQPLGCVDYDGPGERLAQVLSAACGLPVRKLGGRPGSLGTWLGRERGVPLVTLELPRRVESDPDVLWARYGPALMAVVAYE